MTARNTAEVWLKESATWQGGEIDLVCCEVRPETSDVKSFLFKAINDSQFKFLPGQFITLELNINDEIINRSYTISSPPTRPHTLSITVKRTIGGVVSNWLHDNMQAGLTIAAFGPHGEFTTADVNVDRTQETKYLFLSAGSGITPLMSMIRTFHELAENKDIVFVHSARSIADIIFRKELDLIAFNQSKFLAGFVCETLSKVEQNEDQQVNTFAGRLSIDNLKHFAPDFQAREIFTCGPALYMAAVHTMLTEAGFNMKHYHEESFSFDELPATIHDEIIAEEAHAEQVASDSIVIKTGFSVEFTKSAKSISCASEQFILDAAKAAGLRLPSACSKGVCGTCKSKLISGQVEMKHGGGIRQREIDQGMILICCAKPLTDLVIEK